MNLSQFEHKQAVEINDWGIEQMSDKNEQKLASVTELNPIHRRPVLGVSGCLLGQNVRFDHGHKKNQYILEELSSHMDFVSMCPEMESGFGAPRPAMQLRQIGKEIRLVHSKQPDIDVTEKLKSYSHNKCKNLSHLDGFIFKKNSPSCGVFRVPVVVHDNGMRDRVGTGIFAQIFQQHYPLIPIEEEGRLNDAALRENFFERVYAYRRWKAIDHSENNVQAFIEFHSHHKFMLMARGSQYYQELGRLVSGTTKKDLSKQRQLYIHRFMQVMCIISKPARQVNVLHHIMGYLKRNLSADDKRELLKIFESYRNRQIPLITPVTLLSHYFRLNPQSYIIKQHYLDPFPEELALRSSV